MRADLSVAMLLLVASALPVSAQSPPSASAAVPTVIACSSLANLRTVLRSVNDDSAAAVPIITDPKSDLGCNVLDRKIVTGIADHVALNGRAYDCLSLQNTDVCHWTVAGSATPAPAAVRSTPPAKPADKVRR